MHYVWHNGRVSLVLVGGLCRQAVSGCNVQEEEAEDASFCTHLSSVCIYLHLHIPSIYTLRTMEWLAIRMSLTQGTGLPSSHGLKALALDMASTCHTIPIHRGLHSVYPGRASKLRLPGLPKPICGQREYIAEACPWIPECIGGLV